MSFFSKLFGQPAIEQVEAAQVQALLSQSPRPFLLDVRSPEEFKQGHVAGAKLIPLPELSAKMNQIPKDQAVICVCASGHRSSAAARQLIAQGYQVSNLRGGMSSWVRAGLPLKKG